MHLKYISRFFDLTNSNQKALPLDLGPLIKSIKTIKATKSITIKALF